MGSSGPSGSNINPSLLLPSSTSVPLLYLPISETLDFIWDSHLWLDIKPQEALL